MSHYALAAARRVPGAGERLKRFVVACVTDAVWARAEGAVFLTDPDTAEAFCACLLP